MVLKNSKMFFWDYEMMSSQIMSSNLLTLCTNHKVSKKDVWEREANLDILFVCPKMQLPYSGMTGAQILSWWGMYVMINLIR